MIRRVPSLLEQERDPGKPWSAPSRIRVHDLVVQCLHPLQAPILLVCLHCHRLQIQGSPLQRVRRIGSAAQSPNAHCCLPGGEVGLIRSWFLR